MSDAIVERDERDRDVLDQHSEENWEQVDESRRKQAVQELQTWLTNVHPDVIERWKDQYRRGKQIGCDDPWFHFGQGSAIRNTLRNAVPDDKLPWVEYPGGKRYKNWDDFYTAALREALGLVRDPD